eukprot:TRINITY_DN8857_c0_g1_i2.p1 TRINITY_DN8857_c0_g1~~TRINITY_DN8857_c0_g1_i2.p1  ORF type:complete len:427 (+),score=117.65 TRINITY_DN8857_c0_g1_i2:601-1881(+)
MLGECLPKVCGAATVGAVTVYRSRPAPPPAGGDAAGLTCTAGVSYMGPAVPPGVLPAVLQAGADGAWLQPASEMRPEEGRGCMLLEVATQPLSAAVRDGGRGAKSLYGKVWIIGGATEPLGVTQLVELLRVTAPSAARHLCLASLASQTNRMGMNETEFMCECADEKGASALRCELDEQRVMWGGFTHLISCEYTSQRSGSGPGERSAREAVYKPLFVPREHWGKEPAEWSFEAAAARSANRALVQSTLSAATVSPNAFSSASHWVPSPASTSAGTTPTRGPGSGAVPADAEVHACFPSAPIAAALPAPPPDRDPDVVALLQKSVEAVRSVVTESYSSRVVDEPFLNAVLLGAAAYAAAAGHWRPRSGARPGPDRLRDEWRDLLAHFREQEARRRPHHAEAHARPVGVARAAAARLPLGLHLQHLH